MFWDPGGKEQFMGENPRLAKLESLEQMFEKLSVSLDWVQSEDILLANFWEFIF